MKYANVGKLTDLADGRIVEPGQVVELSSDEAEESHNRSLIDAGRLVKVEAAKSSKEVKEGGKTGD